MVGCSEGCINPNAADDSTTASPIHWSECGYDVGDHACDFTLASQDGGEWNLYSHYGDIIVLDFSTEWCGYCHIAAEKTQETQDAYSDFQYVTIMVEDLSGNSPPIQEALQRWAEHYSITAPILAGSRDMLDTGDGGWSVTGWPTFYILDEDLVIREIIRGYSEEKLTQSIESIINPS